MSEYIESVVSKTSKLDWAFPFQRTGAFPLDRSSVFSSYADAVLYAAQGEDERGLSGSSYVGQPISVYDADSNTVTLYVIEADRSLKEVGSAPAVDGSSIELLQDKIQLKDFGVGYYAYVPAEEDEDGNVTEASYVYTEGFKEGLELRIVEVDGNFEIAWYETNDEELETIRTSLEVLSTTLKEKANAADVYTKTEVDTLVAEAGHIKRKKVSDLSEIDLTAEDAEYYIYMVLADTDIENNDIYDEYMVIDGALEKVGSWTVSLDGYVTEDELAATLTDYATTETVDNLNTLVIGKVDSIEGYQLISSADVAKLETIQANAEPNFIKSVASEFIVTDEGRLELNEISVAQVANLQDLLDGKVNVQTSLYNGVETEWTLLSPENAAKLSALVIGDSGVEISGKVNADNVEGLGSWITSNRDAVTGLYPTADQEKLATITAGAEPNFIKSVVTTEFNVDENGQLSLVSVPVSKIEDLETVLPFTAVSEDFNIVAVNEVNTLYLANSYITTSVYAAEVGDLAQLIRMTEEENSTLVDEINYINERLQWIELD